jgi:hypothetical protein
MRSMVEGFPRAVQKSPSTSLRLVPLPCKCRGGNQAAQLRMSAGSGRGPRGSNQAK